MIHPAKWSLEEYKFSADPTVEVHFFTSVSRQFLMAGGLYAQTGKHNWLEFTGHTFVDEFGIPYPLRTDYSRRLEFFSLGIPLKLEWKFRNSFIHSVLMGVTGGKHLELSMADYLHSVHIADLEPDYNRFFGELNIGIRKDFYKNRRLKVVLSPEAGFRLNSSDKSIGSDNYIFYGLGVSTIIGK